MRIGSAPSATGHGPSSGIGSAAGRLEGPGRLLARDKTVGRDAPDRRRIGGAQLVHELEPIERHRFEEIERRLLAREQMAISRSR